MDNIVRLTYHQKQELLVALEDNLISGRGIRVATGADGDGTPWFKYDAGYGWTPPLYGENW